MLEHLKAPVKAMIGPWSHDFPHNAYLKPQMEWRNEAVRWFDYWLRGADTGIMKEPRFAVYVRHWHPPGPVLENVPGTWRWEEGWPISRIHQQAFFPQPDHTLSDQVAEPALHQLRNIPSIGIEACGPVMWWGDVAPDQRPTDAFSLVYDSEPLSNDLEILGLPHAQLTVAANAPHANWFVRVSDVAPDGTVTMVAGAGLNGTHRESDREPKAIEPGKEFPIEIEMHFTSWVFPKGHRIRFAVNNSQWPMFWPSKYPVTTSMRLGPNASRLLLPIVPYENRPVPSFLPPENEPSMPDFVDLDAGNSSGYGEIGTIERTTSTHANHRTESFSVPLSLGN
jgi:putative CocE/NonD family hydrolase